MAILCATGMAQIPEATKKAAGLYQEKNYTEAQSFIDESVNGEGASSAYTWHVRGHIYKELYKQVDNFNRTSNSRKEAVKSFEKSIELDSKNEYKEWNKTSLKYLSSTFWNDAVNLIENADADDLGQAEDAFESYKNTSAIINKEQDNGKISMDFYKAYATGNRMLIEKQRKVGADPANYATEFGRIKDCYTKTLGIDAEDYTSNYNFAITLYNEAAYRIERIPADADLTILLLEQEGCVALFKQALPHAKKAYDERPGRIEILKALRAIYLSLSEYELFEKYDLLIKEKQGEIGAPSKPDLESLRKTGILDH